MTSVAPVPAPVPSNPPEQVAAASSRTSSPLTEASSSSSHDARPRSASLSNSVSPVDKTLRRSPLGRTMSMGTTDFEGIIDPSLLPAETITSVPAPVPAPAADGAAIATDKARTNKPVLPRVYTLASLAGSDFTSFSSADNTPDSYSTAEHAAINGTEGYLESPLSDSSFVIPPSEAATADDADVPGPVKKSHARKQPVGHIKRARNAFILFRKHITDSKLIPASVEVKHQNISVVAAKMWKEAPQEVRAKFQEMARIEKEEHQRLYPGYRYQPVFRRTDIVRRRVRKDPSEDERVDAVADALMQGKAGGSLEKEIKDQMLPTPDASSESGLSSAARSRSRRRRDPGQMSKGAIKAQKAQARQKQMRANLLGHNLLTVSMYNAAQQQAEAQQRAAALAAAEQQYHDSHYLAQDHAHGHLQGYEYGAMMPAEHSTFPTDMYRLPSMSFDPLSHAHPHPHAHVHAHAHPHAHVQAPQDQAHWSGVAPAATWDQAAPAATYDASMGLAMYASDYSRPQAAHAPAHAHTHEHQDHAHAQQQQALPPIQAGGQLYGWHEDEDVPSRHLGLIDEGLFGGELTRRDEGLEDFESSVQQAQSW